MRKLKAYFVTSVLIISQAFSQPSNLQAVKKYTTANAATIVNEFNNFLVLPNVAAEPAGLQKNASFIMEMMNKRGIQNVQLLQASTAGVPPAVYGDVTVPGAKQTLIFYAHYDGQPVNAAQWASG